MSCIFFVFFFFPQFLSTVRLHLEPQTLVWMTLRLTFGVMKSWWETLLNSCLDFDRPRGKNNYKHVLGFLLSLGEKTAPVDKLLYKGNVCICIYMCVCDVSLKNLQKQQHCWGSPTLLYLCRWGRRVCRTLGHHTHSTLQTPTSLGENRYIGHSDKNLQQTHTHS